MVYFAVCNTERANEFKSWDGIKKAVFQVRAGKGCLLIFGHKMQYLMSEEHRF